MPETRFPGQHTTTATVTSSTTVQTNLRFDPSYMKTIPGVLKVIQVMCSLLGFICIQFSRYNTDYFEFKGKVYYKRDSSKMKDSYFGWISTIAICFTGKLLAFYLFHIVEKFYKIPWLRVEFGFCGLWAFLYLIAASLACTVHDEPHSAAVFFGFVATAAYAVDCFMKWRAARAGALAQGTRVVVFKQTPASAATA